MNQFWKEFPLKYGCLTTVKIIVGQEPYKQALAGINFSVECKKSKVPLYQDIGNIAFLVNEWIKVQDSLEMIFNLLFGRENSLKALSYLRMHAIPANVFAEQLWSKAKVLLVNRFVGGVDQKSNIEEFIKSNESARIHVLFVGKKAYEKHNIEGNYQYALALHPSGNNLRLSEKYADNWYYCKGEQLKPKSANFCYEIFRVSSHITKHLRVIPNAWNSQFKVGFRVYGVMV
ncbi:hypothetical protein [Vibrio nereis]|nr:hypothetical protein [Vibrio nereis]